MNNNNDWINSSQKLPDCVDYKLACGHIKNAPRIANANNVVCKECGNINYVSTYGSWCEDE